MPRRLVEAVEVTENQIHLICLKGIFDASTVSEFEKVVSYLLTRNFYCMVVDLSAVEFISSAGWGAFTAELRRVRENNGDIKLAGMSADLFDVFLLLELDRFINAYETADEAIMAFLQPPPEPAYEEPIEVPEALHERFSTPAMEEAVADYAPASYDTAPPALMAARNGDREQYDHNNDFYVPATSPALTPGNDDYWPPRENFNDDETLEIEPEPEQRLLGSGRERRERLLTSGQATIQFAEVPRILPPPAAAPEENRNYHETPPAPPYDINDASNEAEFDFYEPDAGLVEHEEPIASADTEETFPALNLRAADEPALEVEKSFENFELAASSHQPEREFGKPRPRKFSWQEAEAFSELSLDLESHLQTPGRYEESEDDFNPFEEFHEEKPSAVPAPPERHEETQKFNTIVFDNDEGIEENNAGDETHWEAPNAGMADLQPAGEMHAPVFHDDEAGETRETPLFNDFTPLFQSHPNVESQRMKPEHNDDFETQDIRDPWILEEIDTLPEEYEMDDAGTYADRPIAAEEFSAFDFENETAMPVPAAEDALKYEVSPLPIAEEQAIEEMPSVDSNGAALSETDMAPHLITPDNESDEAIANDAAYANEPLSVEQNREEDLALPETLELPATVEALPAAAISTGEVPKIPMSGDLAEMIRGIIAAYPHFGPTMIGKFLEERVEPPVYLSRSTIYRYLREANLSTRRQRFEYAGEEFPLTDEATYDA